MTNKILTWLLLSIILMAILICVGPIPQLSMYHDFADKRSIFGIPYGLNILSNFAFLFAALYGIFNTKQNFLNRFSFIFYMLFFVFIILAALGSVYYHLNPNNLTLYWDRLSTSLAITTMASGLILEMCKNYKLGLGLSLSLIIFGVFSVVYWEYSEQIGRGDLRLYAITQALSLFIIVIAILDYPKRNQNKYLITAICLLAIARFTEMHDHFLFNLTQHLISGHTLKHLFGAAAVMMFAKYTQRTPLAKI